MTRNGTTTEPTRAGSVAPVPVTPVDYGAEMSDASTSSASSTLSLTLTIPARSDHLRFARLMAVGLATKLDFDYDTIEDLRIAVSELCTALIGACQENGEITLTYRSGGADSIVVDARATYGLGVKGGTPPDELLIPILEAVAEEHRLDLGETTASFMLRMRAASVDVL